MMPPREGPDSSFHVHYVHGPAALIDIGEKDAVAQADEIAAFLSGDE